MFRKLNAVGDTRRDDLEMLFEGGNQFFAFFVCLDCSLDLINLFFGQKNDLGLRLWFGFGFGLGWQLWAREPLENPYRETGKPPIQQEEPKAPVSQVREVQPEAKPKPAKTSVPKESKVVFLTDDQLDEVKAAVKAYEKRDELITAFKKHFKIIAPRIADRIQFPEHKEFIDKYIAENP